MKRIILLPLLLCCNVLSLFAQTSLHIEPLFREYAVREDATEILLTGKALKEYKLTDFHSLEIRSLETKDVLRIEQKLSADVATAIIHEENKREGRLLYGLYELPSSKQHIYIFYRHKPERLTLIHIQGRATVDEMKAIFKK